MILHQGLACGRCFCDMMWSYASLNVRQSLPAYVLGQFDFATLLSSFSAPVLRCRLPLRGVIVRHHVRKDRQTKSSLRME